ncbi:MAG: MFS transporter [Thermodesulfobacteriota bacterium]
MTDTVQPKELSFWQRTLSSLRYRDFRLVWLGSCTEHMGQNMETMAVAWLMKELTESPYYLGLLAVCKVAPLILFALLGGVVTDRVDRRKLLITCLLGGALISIALLILVRAGSIAPWHLLTATALGAVLTGFNHPARAAIIPNLTPKEEWMNATALDTISVRTANIVTSPVAGYLIFGFGTAMLLGARALGMGLAVVWLLLAKVPPTPISAKKHGAWSNLSKGLVYAASSGVIMSLVLVFALREFQAEMSNVFLPFFADDILRSGATGFGYLNMANGLGALVGLFGIATLGNFRYKGWLIIITGIVTGLFLSAFPLSKSLILSILLLFGVNAFGTVFENVGRTALQIIVPDEMRGRVNSIREFVRGLFGTWVAFGLGLGGEYLGVVTASILLGVFIIVSVSAMAFLLSSFRKL